MGKRNASSKNLLMQQELEKAIQLLYFARGKSNAAVIIALKINQMGPATSKRPSTRRVRRLSTQQSRAAMSDLLSLKKFHQNFSETATYLGFRPHWNLSGIFREGTSPEFFLTESISLFLSHRFSRVLGWQQLTVSEKLSSISHLSGRLWETSLLIGRAYIVL